MKILDPKEAWIRLHTQEVRGSSPCAPTILFTDLRGAVSGNSGLLLFRQVVPRFFAGKPLDCFVLAESLPPE
jgi:hypothetical protein